jgi:hypothetical protein
MESENIVTEPVETLPTNTNVFETVVSHNLINITEQDAENSNDVEAIHDTESVIADIINDIKDIEGISIEHVIEDAAEDIDKPDDNDSTLPKQKIKKKKLTKKKRVTTDPATETKNPTTVKKQSNYYDLDISDIPKYITAMNKYMELHPEFFRTKINTKYVYINENAIHIIYGEPVVFNDTLHGAKGYIRMAYDKIDRKIEYVISIKSPLKEKRVMSESYIAKVEEHVNNQLISGNVVNLYYNKLLSDTIIKYNYYSQSINQWKADVKILQDEFFLNNKDYLLAIMNNKVTSHGIGSVSSSWNNMILHGPPGTGKCLGWNTPVLMYDGSIKMVQDVTLDDVVMGDDSTPRSVETVVSGKMMMYRVSQAIGQLSESSYVVNEAHILSLYYVGEKQFMNIPYVGDDGSDKGYYVVTYLDRLTVTLMVSKYHYDKENYDSYDKAMEFFNSIDDSERFVDISVKDYMELPPVLRKDLMGYKTSVRFQERDYSELERVPYLYGTHLAYHCVNSDNRIIDSKVLKLNTGSKVLRIPVTSIPDVYKYNSPENLCDLLAGIVEGAGQFSKDARGDDVAEISIMACNDDLVFIANSLGYWARVNDDRLCIGGASFDRIFYKCRDLDKKQNITDKPDYNETIRHLMPIMVAPIGVDRYYGFGLDGNRRFVMGDFTVTHNSSFVNRTAMTLKLSISSVDLSLFLNKKRELYALLHGQDFNLPNSEDKQPALTNCIIALEEFDTAIERILDIENIFKYKDILKRNYLDMKNAEIQETVSSYVKDCEVIIEEKTAKAEPLKPLTEDITEEEMMNRLMLEDGIDVKNNTIMEDMRDELMKKRSHDNQMNSINIELNNIIKSMDDDNKSNILRLADLKELLQPAVPIKDRIIIATTNHYEKIKNCMPALFRSGRMSSIEFGYLDWPTLNKLTNYYFRMDMVLPPFEICIPTSEIIELAIRIKLNEDSFSKFQNELMRLCRDKK